MIRRIDAAEGAGDAIAGGAGAGSGRTLPPTGVDGTLVSCFGAAMAVYLERTGRDWLPVIGSSAELSLKPLGGGRYVFRHLPAGLRADGAALDLVRAGADDPAAAVAGIEAELRARGAVIVCADAFGLPWTPAHGRRHGTHWIVVDAAWHVTDVFEATAEAGQDRPWSGWTDRDTLAGWARATPRLDPVARLQERHAFGDDGDESGSRDQTQDENRAGDRDHGARGMENATFQWFRRRRPEEPAPRPCGAGWLSGAAALGELAAHFEAHGARPEAYCQAEELWMAARQHQLHLRFAEKSGLSADRLRAVEETAELWGPVPMVAFYARRSADRPGGAKTGPLVAVLRQLADLSEARDRAS